jgi:hypothetical protein
MASGREPESDLGRLLEPAAEVGAAAENFTYLPGCTSKTFLFIVLRLLLKTGWWT